MFAKLFKYQRADLIKKGYTMHVPADVPAEKKELFTENLKAITRNKDHLFLFAADQKIEHLNEDFHGKGIHPDAAGPQHLFRIAQQGNIGAFATQFGLIERYGMQYPDIDYIVKLNSKTNIIKQRPHSLFWGTLTNIANILYNRDPISSKLWSVDDVAALKQTSGLSIRGVGYTIYLGSKYENKMLAEAAQVVHNAHKKGLVAILWIYPRGMHVSSASGFELLGEAAGVANALDEAELLAGATGVANALGADVVKVRAPAKAEQLEIAKQAAGNTMVVTSGGKQVDKAELLKRIYEQIHNGHINGAAIGRNIFQHSLQDAIKLTQAVSAIVYDNATVEQAKALL